MPYNPEQEKTLHIIDSSKDARQALVEGDVTKSMDARGSYYRFHQNVRFTERFVMFMICATMGF